MPSEAFWHQTEVEKIHATILYYLAKKEKVGAYLERVRQLDEEASQEQLRNPPPFIVELRERLAKVSQKLLEAKESSAKSVDTLHHT